MSSDLILLSVIQKEPQSFMQRFEWIQQGIANIVLCFHSDRRAEEDDRAHLATTYVQSSVQKISQQTPKGNTKSWSGRLR